MSETYEEAAKKIFDFAQAGQGCPMLDEVRKLSYSDMTRAFDAAQALEDLRVGKMSELKAPLVTFKSSEQNNDGLAFLDVTILDPGRDQLRTNIFHYRNGILAIEGTRCTDLRPKETLGVDSRFIIRQILDNCVGIG